MIPQWLLAIADMVCFAWTVGSMILWATRTFGGDTSGHPLRSVVSELRPLYLPAVVVIVAYHTQTHALLGWNTFGDACYVLNWFFYKDEGDDRWKRRAKKAAEKITRRGARLVVVPAGGRA